MEVGDQERNVVALPPRFSPSSRESSTVAPLVQTHLNRLSPQNEEVFGSLRQEPRELVHENILDLVGLLDLDRDADRVDGGFDEHTLVFVPGHGQRVQKHL
jgi:hypothetical protein